MCIYCCGMTWGQVVSILRESGDGLYCSPCYSRKLLNTIDKIIPKINEKPRNSIRSFSYYHQYFVFFPPFEIPIKQATEITNLAKDGKHFLDRLSRWPGKRGCRRNTQRSHRRQIIAFGYYLPPNILRYFRRRIGRPGHPAGPIP